MDTRPSDLAGLCPDPTALAERGVALPLEDALLVSGQVKTLTGVLKVSPVVQVVCWEGHSLGIKLSGHGEKWQKMAFPLVSEPDSDTSLQQPGVRQVPLAQHPHLPESHP